MIDQPIECVIKEVSGGATNQNYLLEYGNDSYFIRLSNDNEQLGASLNKEYHCTKLTSQQEISPSVVLFWPEKKLLITNFIKSNQSKVDLTDPITLRKVLKNVRVLHQMDEPFTEDFSIFDTIRNYEQQIRAKDIYLPSYYYLELSPALDQIESELVLTKAPCHLDLHSGNFIDDGEKIWIIDWEYAANADPFFDLAVLSSTENFSDIQMYQVLQIYLDRTPSPQEFEKLYQLRIAADVRWGLWCLIQSLNSTLDYPYQEKADEFLTHAHERCVNN